MPKKQWSTTFDEETLKTFQNTCNEYGMKANMVLDALMKFFNDGKCRLVIEKGGLVVETKNETERCYTTCNKEGYENASSI